MHVPLQSPSPIVQISCGADYSVVLLGSGDVYSTGNGSYGIHGCGQELDNRFRFAPVGYGPEGFFHHKQIRYVSAGENHCGVVDLFGNAFTWGRNSSGQCGVKQKGNA